MVVGETGLGKSTLVNCLFNTKIQFRPEDKVDKKRVQLEDNVVIKPHVVDIEEKGVRLKLTVVSTDGFGDGLDSSKSPQPISDYIDHQFEKYFDFENGINRRTMVDSRVHCCFYFISPHSLSVTALDISLMQEIHHKVKPEQVELVRRDYVANSGWETFLTYEDVHQDILIGLLRLRKVSSQAFCQEFKGHDSVSMVRELHVYGSVVPVSAKDPTKFQHQGYGMLLMQEAERIAREEHGSTKILVISGVGTRNYYRKMGYELDGPYMSKLLPTED